MIKEKMRNLGRKMLQEALIEAKKARGRVSPNPPVGAVVFNGQGKILGRGYTQPPGKNHAEIQALKKAGDSSKNAQLAVTLEPCCHTGKTAPCVQALVQAGIKKVWLGVLDKNPLVAGKGITYLKRRGIQVEVFNDPLLEEFYEAFFYWVHSGKPYVILKMASTWNGLFRLPHKKWITGLPARREVHRLRAQVDAIGVGKKTVLEDNPRLNVRHVRGPHPHRFIFTTNPKMDSGLNIFSPLVPTSVFFLKNQGYSFPIKFKGIPITKKGHGLNLEECLKWMGSRGITSFLLEGGPTLAASFLNEGLTHKIYWFVSSPPAGKEFTGYSLPGLNEPLALVNPEFRKLGEDLLVKGYL